MRNPFRHLPQGRPFGNEEYELTCPSCRTAHRRSELLTSDFFCPSCGTMLRIPARDRIRLLADEGSFAELNAGISSLDFLGFPGYREKIDKARAATGERSAVVTGVMRVEGQPCAVYAMDARFIMASVAAISSAAPSPCTSAG